MASASPSAPVRPVALVTGASRGIGVDIAKALAAKGFDLALQYNGSEAALTAVAADIRALHPLCDVKTFRSDLSAAGAAEPLFAAVAAAYDAQQQRVTVLVNNAGIFVDHDVQSADCSFAEFAALNERTMRVNYFAPAELSFLFTRYTRAKAAAASAHSGGGDNGVPARIINITSRAAYRGEFAAPGYAASKAAISIFGQSYAKTLAGDGANGVLVFNVAPGWVGTEMAEEVTRGPAGVQLLKEHPLGRIATTEEAGRLVAFLATDAPAAMTGSSIDMNGATYLR